MCAHHQYLQRNTSLATADFSSSSHIALQQLSVNYKGGKNHVGSAGLRLGLKHELCNAALLV